MGFLQNVFGGGSSVGLHPDSAIKTSGHGDALKYIYREFACPSCGKKASAEVLGHSQVLRRMKSGKGKMYDAYRVSCRCGKVTTFWADSSSWCDKHVEMAEMLCNPNGKCVAIAGSGQMPTIDPSLQDKDFGSRKAGSASGP